MGVLADIRVALRAFVTEEEAGEIDIEDPNKRREIIVGFHPELMKVLADLDGKKDGVEQAPFGNTGKRESFAKKYEKKKGSGGEEMSGKKLEEMKKTLEGTKTPKGKEERSE